MFTHKVFADPIYIGFLYLCFFLYILFIKNLTPEHFNMVFTNVFIQFGLLFIAIIFATYNKGLGIFYMLAFVFSFMSSYYTYVNTKNLENFSVVEDDENEIINFQKNSLLNKLENKEEYVRGVWGCSAWGRKLGLCKI